MLKELLKEIQIKNAELIEPSTIKYIENGSPKYLTLNNEAARFIYSRIKVTYNVSKKLFQLDPTIWKELINMKMTEFAADIGSLSSYNYMVNGNTIVSMYQEDLSIFIKKFDEFCDTIDARYFVNPDGVLQFFVTTDIDDHMRSIILIDMDINNGHYVLYTGVIRDDRIVMITAPVIDVGSFMEFMQIIDIENEVSVGARMASNISDIYNIDDGKKIVMSVREVLDIIKRTGLKVNVNDADGMVINVEDVNRRSSDILTIFLNSFNMPYKSLKKLGYFRKALRYDTVSLDNMLQLLTVEYFNESNNVKASDISLLLRIYDSRESDRNVLEDETRK